MAKLEEMRKHADELQAEFSRKDKEMNDRISALKKEAQQMKLQKAEFEAEKHQATDNLLKAQTKLEEEIQLRLFFEQKLNTLYLVNMEAESRAALLTDTVDKLQINNCRLGKENYELQKERKALMAFKNTAVAKEGTMQANTEVIQLSQLQASSKATQLQAELDDYMERDQEQVKHIEDLSTKLTQAELSLHKTENELATTQGDNKQLKDSSDQQRVVADTLKGTAARQERELAQMQQERDQDLLRIVDLHKNSQRLAAAKAEDDEEIEELTEAIGALEARCVELSEVIRAVEELRKDERSIRLEMHAEVRTLQLHKADLETRLSH